MLRLFAGAEDKLPHSRAFGHRPSPVPQARIYFFAQLSLIARQANWSRRGRDFAGDLPVRVKNFETLGEII